MILVLKVSQEELLQVMGVLKHDTNYDPDGSYFLVELADIKANIYCTKGGKTGGGLRIDFDVTLKSPKSLCVTEDSILIRRRYVLTSIFNIVEPILKK